MREQTAKPKSSKILMVSTDKAPGGIDVMVEVYEKALAQLGCETTTIGYSYAPVMQKPCASRVKRVFLPTFWRLGLRFNLPIRRKLQALIDEADIILFHTRSPLVRFAPLCKGKPVALIGHSGKITNISHIDYMITVSDDLRHTVLDKHKAFQHRPEAVFVLPNGLVTSPVFRADRALHQPLKIGGLGRFFPRKNLSMLIDLLSLSGQEKTQLLLCGTGAEEKKLMAQASRLGVRQRVSMPGWVHDLDKFFNDVDIFCVPSISESFGLVIIEAMAAGVPVITTPTAGGNMIIRHGENGLHIPHNDVQALADAIEHLRDDKRRANITRQARADFEKYYKFDVFCKNLGDILSAIMMADSNKRII